MPKVGWVDKCSTLVLNSKSKRAYSVFRPEAASPWSLLVPFCHLNHNSAFASCTNLFVQGLRRLTLSGHAVAVKAAAKEEPKWVVTVLISSPSSSLV